MSKKFSTVKYFHDHELWSKSRVRNAVGRWITAEEYKIITGEDYVEVQGNE